MGSFVPKMATLGGSLPRKLPGKRVSPSLRPVRPPIHPWENWKKRAKTMGHDCKKKNPYIASQNKNLLWSQ